MPVVYRSRPTQLHSWKLVGAVSAAALFLSACSDSSSSETEDVAVDIDSAGRLVLYDNDAAALAVLDLETETVLQRFALSGGEPSLYASPDKRHAVVIQRDDNLVSFLDAGLYSEDHGDHLHDYAEDPVMVDFTLSGVRPTHYSVHAEQGVIFFDAQDGVPSSVAVQSEADIGAGLVTGELTLSNNMHGAAKFVDNHLFVTYRDPSIVDTTLPAAIERYGFADGVFTFEHRYDEACPLLHGNASNEELIAFGCGDGVLIINLKQEGYPATKLANPESMLEDGRVGTVIAHPEIEEVVGVAGNQVFVIDPDEEQVFQSLSFPDGQTMLAQGFNVDGETYYILGDDGHLYLYDVTADWAPLPPVMVTDSVGEEDASPIVVASAASERLYVLNTNGQQIIEVDSIDGTLVRTIELGYTATRMAWLGLSDSHDHQD